MVKSNLMRGLNAVTVIAAVMAVTVCPSLAARTGHERTPAHSGQFTGDHDLTPQGARPEGEVTKVAQSGGESVLPPAAQEPAGAALPLASFMRSNAGWMVNVSLPEPAIQFGYRIGETGAFQDPGLHDHLDQRTGRRAPRTSFAMSADQPAATIYVTWRDKSGKQAAIFPIAFNPDEALAAEQKKILEMLWTAWISFRDWNGTTVYFSHLVSYRCGIAEVRYGFDDGPVDKVWPLPPCDAANPHSVPQDADIYMTVPKGIAAMSVLLTYHDGTTSPLRRFNIVK
jgi:hypothetical protein